MSFSLYRLHSAGEPIGNSPSGTRRVLLHAVAKRNNPTGAAYCLANEHICGELARFLRLPAPPAGLVTSPEGEVHIAALDFNVDASPLPPVDIGGLLHYLPSLAAGLLLFDIWIANPDRHNGNLFADFTADPPRLNIFDHGQALLGHIAGDGIPRLTLLRDALGTGSCILTRIKEDTHFPVWLKRIRSTPDFFIEELCRESLALGPSAEEAEAAAAFLQHRRDALPQILQTHRSKFKKLTAWNQPPPGEAPRP